MADIQPNPHVALNNAREQGRRDAEAVADAKEREASAAAASANPYEVHVSAEIPGYDEAIASEQRDRSAAFLALPELIAGHEVAQITPYRWEWLRYSNSPLACGGRISDAAICQFLWLLSPDFNPRTPQAAFDSWLESQIKSLDFNEALRGIDDFLERTFLDAPQASTQQQIPYFSATASIIHTMNNEPFRWSYEQVIHTPLRVIYQLIRCELKAHGQIIVNKRSDKLAGDWLDTLNVKLQEARNGD